ncbi:MAG: 50S ribosomal protein L11 methyltransferase [Defluviitaleaceae bacterium]|nr:50S ribosomal protein L11 methyltransferase [Defluviitaleaceae bacterium]
MEWIKVAIETTTYGAEIITGMLIANGVSGMEIIDPQDRIRHLTETIRTWDFADEVLLQSQSNDVYVIFYLEESVEGKKVLELLKGELDLLIKKDTASEFGKLALILESANDETWLNEWKKHFKPMHIGNIVIVPEWENYEPTTNEIVFTIDPGTAFGTGQHQTTQLCIKALQKSLKPRDRLLDIGCGSGILSIIGLLLGADTVFACDIDPAGAMSATKKNASLNAIDINKLQIYAGDAISDEGLRTSIIENPFDVIVANIVADVIIALLPLFKRALKLNGVFIASGIIDERLDDVLTAARQEGFEIIEYHSLEGWRCIVGKIGNAHA